MGTGLIRGPAAASAPRGPVPARRLSIGAVRASRDVQVLVAITLFAAAIRFATLNVQSVWLDESATIVLVHRGFSGMLSHLSASESAPPLYYILVWAWTKVFGAGTVGFRSFSALVGTITVPVVYAAGRRVSARTGLWAAAIAACSPAMYYYSQEARAYALLILFSAAAFAVWQRAMQEPTGRRLALWSGFSILALLSHYFAVFMFLPQALLLIRRAGLRRTWAACGAFVVVGAALAPLAAAQHSNTRKSEWIEETSLGSRVLETVKLFLVGVYGPLETVTAVLAGLLVLGALALVVRRADQDARRVAANAAIVAALALLIPLVGAATHVLDVFDGRNVIAIWVPCVVIVAIGVAVRGVAHVGPVIGAALCALSLAVIAGINALPAYQRDDWRGAAHALPAPRAPRLIVSAELSSIPLSLYLPRPIIPLLGNAFTVREVDFITLRTKGSNGRAAIAPLVIRRAPPGFRLASVRRSESYAVSRFVAAQPSRVAVSTLRRIAGEAGAEVMGQR